FPVVCCNFYTNKECPEQPDWVKSIVYKEIEQVKIAIIGAPAPFRDYYEEMGWGIEEPISSIKKKVAGLDEDTDVVIL
ncbi:bifunctional metallophosphatase/5'-nucleotidase, partial [Listeria monocytogenes]|nr:bifunctional metallophosphatase/5'-nucleotidase [Listeria monocytogenes]